MEKIQAWWQKFKKFYRTRIKPRSLTNFFFLTGVVLLGLVVLLALLIFYYALQVPDPSILAVRRVIESTKI